jgi:ubiquinone/menaquinone biosynthesis C-methylase UbiE
MPESISYLADTSMQRVPEPEELMDDKAQAAAYAEADFSEANGLFVDLLEAMAPRELSGRLLDLGCGPADIPLRLAARHARIEIDALDGALSMLDIAQQVLDTQPSLVGRVHLVHDRLPSTRLAQRHYQYLVSNSLLHHMQDPAVLWQTIADCAKPGAWILVMDLARPHSPTAVDALVETHAIDAPEVLRRDFRNSLFAAYTPDEVQRQLSQVGLSTLKVESVSDRHLAAMGQLPF